MKKKMKTKPRIFGLFLFLLGCLLATGHALAANPTTLTVGGTDVQSGGYWTTNADGTLTPDGASADNYNVYHRAGGHQHRHGRSGSKRRIPEHPCVWEPDHPRRRQPDRAGR